METDERWLPVVGFEGKYWVSSYGRVKSAYRGLMKILKPHIRVGYSTLYLCHVNPAFRRDGKDVRIHVLVLTAFVGPRPEGHYANHKDGVKTNNNLLNLEWVTPRENILHALRMGLLVPVVGQNHGNSKLSDIDRAKMVAMYESGEFSYKKLGDRFGLCPQSVWETVQRAWGLYHDH